MLKIYLNAIPFGVELMFTEKLTAKRMIRHEIYCQKEHEREQGESIFASKCVLFFMECVISQKNSIVKPSENSPALISNSLLNGMHLYVQCSTYLYPKMYGYTHNLVQSS